MFVLSKIGAALVDPFSVLLLMSALAAALLFTRHWRGGRALLVAVLTAWVATAVLPLDSWLVEPLENRFPAPPCMDSVEGIIILGGAVNPTISAARGIPAIGGSAERLLAIPDLARHHPQAKLVFTGGSGSVLDQEHKEAAFANRLLQSIGMDTSRIVFEDQSRNTRENAVFSRALAGPDGQGRWLLVTSAIHMPRAMGTFRAHGWNVVAYPVDYTTMGNGRGMPSLSASDGMNRLGAAMKEWLGLVYYRLRGWSAELYPAP